MFSVTGSLELNYVSLQFNPDASCTTFTANGFGEFETNECESEASITLKHPLFSVPTKQEQSPSLNISNCQFARIHGGKDANIIELDQNAQSNLTISSAIFINCHNVLSSIVSGSTIALNDLNFSKNNNEALMSFRLSLPSGENGQETNDAIVEATATAISIGSIHFSEDFKPKSDSAYILIEGNELSDLSSYITWGSPPDNNPTFDPTPSEQCQQNTTVSYAVDGSQYTLSLGLHFFGSCGQSA